MRHERPETMAQAAAWLDATTERDYVLAEALKGDAFRREFQKKSLRRYLPATAEVGNCNTKVHSDKGVPKATKLTSPAKAPPVEATGTR